MVVIFGAGDLGGALASTLARFDRVGRIRLVDPAPGVAAGVALDIAQGAVIERGSSRIEGTDDPQAAAGARVVVIAGEARADPAAADGDLATIEAVSSRAKDAPVVFASATPISTMERACRELRLPRQRMVGSAPIAYASAVRALVAARTARSPGDIVLSIAGRPPDQGVIVWSGATIAGAPLERVIAPAAMSAIEARVRRIWPPGPYALASAGARVVDALANGSPRQFCCFVVLDDQPTKGRVAAMPVVLGAEGVREVIEPVLSARERVAIDVALDSGSAR